MDVYAAKQVKNTNALCAEYEGVLALKIQTFQIGVN
jgi:hypothetical protein